MFPLYDQLYNLCEHDTKKISNYKIQLFLKAVPNFTDQESENIFCLIYMHYIKTSRIISDYIPYNAKYTNTSSITFEFKEFPEKLKQILFLFFKKYVQKKKIKKSK